MLTTLEDVLDRDEPLEHALRVHHRQLLDPVRGQDPLGVVEAGAHRRGDELLLGHRFADRLIEIPLELQIAVGDDADEPALSIHDRHARDLEPPHERVRLAQRTVGAERDRIEDHPALAALDLVDFGGLALGRHVLVQDADAAGPRHRDRHVRLGDGVHGSGNERNVEGDVTSKVAGGRNFAGMDRGVSRDQEDVVERQAGLGADDGHIRDGPPWPLRALGRPVASCSITKIRAWVRGTQAGGSVLRRQAGTRLRQIRYTGTAGGHDEESRPRVERLLGRAE